MIKRNSINFRVLVIILILSLLFSVLSIGVIFSIQYKQLRINMEEEIETLKDAQYHAIAEGLWNYDYPLIIALLDGFCMHPYVNYASVVESNGKKIETGSMKPDLEFKSYPLSRVESDGNILTLGVLSFQIDSHLILSDINRQILQLIFSQGIMIILLSFTIIILLFRYVTKPLSYIAEHIGSFRYDKEFTHLSLKKNWRGVELTTLVDSFNLMNKNLEEGKRAERKTVRMLQESETVNRILIEKAPDAILMLDLDLMRYISCNNKAEEIFGKSKEELLRIEVNDLLAPEQPDESSSVQNMYEKLTDISSNQMINTRVNIVNSQGEVRQCELRMTRLPIEGKKIYRISYLDIEDRIKAEKNLKKLLMEKDVLLQEVYHRTKNNMQIIASLLNIQTSFFEDGKINEILQNMIARITAMALVHEKLYESNDLSKIDFGEYLEGLIFEIKQAFLANNKAVIINLQTEPGIFLDISYSVPCGLSVNELVVNALKYAFADERTGRIDVVLCRLDDGSLLLTVEDDGIGMPEGFDFRQNGKIGFQIVVSLIEAQLGGSFVIDSGENGTLCKILLPERILAD